ncbi:MAG: hypothetical protein NZ703_04790, partial [Gemmataceae bacterium]|nr:hypothetical protein [Gemmataceae bacterium]
DQVSNQLFLALPTKSLSNGIFCLSSIIESNWQIWKKTTVQSVGRHCFDEDLGIAWDDRRGRNGKLPR